MLFFDDGGNGPELASTHVDLEENESEIFTISWNTALRPSHMEPAVNAGEGGAYLALSHECSGAHFGAFRN
jgi:hypothetical protein